jgi:hypothetical protein
MTKTLKERYAEHCERQKDAIREIATRDEKMARSAVRTLYFADADGADEQKVSQIYDSITNG